MKQFICLMLSLVFISCLSNDLVEEEFLNSGGTECGEIDETPAPPRDVSPNGYSDLCLRLDLRDVSTLINKTPAEMGEIDMKILFTGSCLMMDSPSNLHFITAVSINKNATGLDYQGDFRVPLPTEIKSAGFLPDGIDLSSHQSSLDAVDGVTLMVGKLVEYKGKRFMKLVNIAQVIDDGGKKYLETLSQTADQYMSSAMKVDGPGIYALYLSTNPMGFLSGQVTLEGNGVEDAVVIVNKGAFLSLSDQQGNYTIVNGKGQSSITATDLETGAMGSLAFVSEEEGSINPKTGVAPETPATQNDIPDVSDLNLVGLDIALEPVVSVNPSGAAPANLDFESGVVTPWNEEGNSMVLDTLFNEMFPGSNENKYIFLSSGETSIQNTFSYLSQTFVIPEGRTKLKVEYNFVSQEYPNWVGSQYNDFFFILIKGAPAYLHSETVNSNEGLWNDFYQRIGNVDLSEPETDIAGVFGGATGRREASFTLPDCGFNEITLVFGVSDMGDRIYDTAVLINRIWLED